MKKRIFGSVAALTLAFVMLFVPALQGNVNAADPVQPNQKQKDVIEAAADYLEEMDMDDMAENVRSWLNDGKISIDMNLRANGTTDRKGEITLKGSFVTPLPQNELERFKRVSDLAWLLLHEKTHAHQAPEGGSLAEGVREGDWTAGYDVMDECVGPDPLEVEAYYKHIRALLIFAEKVQAETIPVGLEPAEQTAAEALKNAKIEWLHAQANRWAAILKTHNFEKAAKFEEFTALSDSFKEIDENTELTEQQKIVQKRVLLDLLISKLFDAGGFYEKAREAFEEKKGAQETTMVIPVEPGSTGQHMLDSADGNGKLTINGLPEEMATGTDEVLEISMNNFAVPPEADPGYSIISPVYEISWNSTLPVPFEIAIATEMESSNQIQVAAFGLKRTENEKDWTLLETYVEEDGGITYATAMCDAATMYALVTPNQTFFDMPPDHWAYESAERLYESGVIDGGALLLPQMQVSREVFVKYLVRALNLEVTSSEVPFTDISPDDPYYPYISTAYHSGLTSGVAEDEFGMGQIIPREQSITFLIRAVGMEAEALAMSESERMGYIDSFFDIYTDCSEWAYPYIAQAVKVLLTNGYPDGTMRGKNLLSHAEVIALIDRIMIHVAYNGR